MPTTSEIVLAAIVILGLTAIALLIAPTVGVDAATGGQQRRTAP